MVQRALAHVGSWLWLFFHVQNGGVGLDYMDQKVFRVSICSNSYLFDLKFKIPVFLPKAPMGAKGS